MNLSDTRKELGHGRAYSSRGVPRGNSILWFCLLIFVAATPTAAIAETETQQPIIGLVENVRIHPGALTLPAKIDTGADNSSLNAADIRRFTRAGEKWVRFEVTDADGHTITLERKLVRIARVKRQHGESQRRPVVMLGICLGNLYREVQVTLVDRSRFRYPVLIGRSFMRDSLLVDPSLKFTAEPKCPEPAADDDERD